MRILKIFFIISTLLLAIYAVSMLFVDESKNFTIEKKMNYPVEKLFPQFNNLQNFTEWNSHFSENDNYSFNYYSPYQGVGSSMNYRDLKDDDNFGDLFIRYENPLSTLKYQLFEGKKNNPYRIDVKFVPLNTNSTKIIWYIRTPKQPLLKRALNLISEDYIADNIDKSMQNLSKLLSGKVDKENELANMKFDSLMVEDQEGMLLLGINVTTSNKKGLLQKNIVLNHNKVINFVSKDLQKKEDEFGVPVFITDASSFKEKEVSYFYGVPLSQREGITDNNFSFRTLNASKNYIMYYKGPYQNRVRSIGILLNKAKKDSMRNGQLHEFFLSEPSDTKDVTLKLSLPVFR